MPFTDEDRNILIKTHTLLEAHEKRLDSKDLEDDVLHKRINEVHGRINTMQKVFSGVIVAVNGAVAGFMAFWKGN